MQYTLDDKALPNMFSLLAKQLDAHIDDSPNVLGFSDSPKGARKTVLKKIYDIKTQMNNRMLFGKIYDLVHEQPIVYNQVAFECYNALHTTEELTEIQVKKEDYWEIRPGKFIRVHPDLYTNLFINENKATAEEVSDFKLSHKDLKVWQYEQLNGYMGFYKIGVGFLHEINQRGFMNPISPEDTIEAYWAKFKSSYQTFVPVYFDKEMYESTIQTIIYLFDCIDKKKVDLPCPRYTFECNNCEVIHLCKNPITSFKLDHIVDCFNCGRKLQKEYNKRTKKEDFPTVFLRNEQIYCKEEKCTQAVLDAWKVE